MLCFYDKHLARALRASVRFYIALRGKLKDRDPLEPMVMVTPREFVLVLLAPNQHARVYGQQLLQFSKHRFLYFPQRCWKKRLRLATESFPPPHRDRQTCQKCQPADDT